MKRFCISLLIFSFISSVLFAAGNIAHIKLEGMIHNVAASFVEKSINKAVEKDVELIVLQINTPGGYSESMEIIIRKIMGSPIPVAVFVGPAGAKAASAGFFIAMSADVVVMSPGTNMGAAHPVIVPMIPTGAPEPGDDEEQDEARKRQKARDDIMSEKVLNDAIAYMKSIVGARKRNIDMALKAVTESKSYTAEEAMGGNLSDFICTGIKDIRRKMDGYEVTRLDGSREKLELKDAGVINIEMSWKDEFLSSLANPTLVFLLLIIAAVGIYAEFTHPGTIFPGAIGFISLILFFFAAQIMPIRVVGILLILTAVVLFVLEVKITSFGLLTIGGIICMVLGGILLIDSPIPEFRVPIIAILPIVAAVAVIVIFLTTLVVKSFKRKTVTGDAGMIGAEGVVTAPLNPEGKVFLFGEIWDAEADTNIKKKEKIIVDKVDGMKLYVKRKK